MPEDGRDRMIFKQCSACRSFIHPDLTTCPYCHPSPNETDFLESSPSPTTPSKSTTIWRRQPKLNTATALILTVSMLAIFFVGIPAANNYLSRSRSVIPNESLQLQSGDDPSNRPTSPPKALRATSRQWRPCVDEPDATLGLAALFMSTVPDAPNLEFMDIENYPPVDGIPIIAIQFTSDTPGPKGRRMGFFNVFVNDSDCSLVKTKLNW